MRKIVFSGHAESKFALLERHGFVVSRETIEAAVDKPDKVLAGYRGRKIAQKAIDKTHVIRVVFEDFQEMIKIITFYPGRRERYEDEL